ncbi:MAG: hypothetical protein EXX96DRAFT_620420 [Benjaminiella poitrasii]|nr:MAG: hypothetical protein EXX96DRAFT_620420 [Benjaminiella poitrasii]
MTNILVSQLLYTKIMINKIYSTLTNNTNESESKMIKDDRVNEDCLPCKITGALGFGGLGAYTLREATIINKIPGRARTAVGLGVTGVVFISAGLYRLIV